MSFLGLRTYICVAVCHTRPTSPHDVFQKQGLGKG